MNDLNIKKVEQRVPIETIIEGGDGRMTTQVADPIKAMSRG